MTDNLLLDEFIKPYEAFTKDCRRIDEDLILFRRDGSIVGIRCRNNDFKGITNFYDVIDPRDASTLTDLCVSFDYRWFITDTRFGCAAVYTDLFGASGLLIALIFHERRGFIKSFFLKEGSAMTYFSPSFENLESLSARAASFERTREILRLTESALSLRLIKSSLGTAGLGVGELLSDGLIEVAEFVGCLGACVASFGRIPDLNSFSPELFSAITLCMSVFARDHGRHRQFSARIAEYNGLAAVLFSVELRAGFDHIRKPSRNDTLPRVCAEISSGRDCFLSYRYVNDGKRRLELWFVPQNDPIPNRTVKQDPESVIKVFWNE